MADDEKTIEIPHHRSNQFTSHFATGVLFAMTPDDMNHLIFYSDSIGIDHELGTKKSEGTFTTSIPVDGLELFREDKARISMSTNTLHNLYKMLKQQIEPDSEKAQDE